MEAVALHDFAPNNTDELAFQRDQVLNVLSVEEDPGWYMAELNGHTGLVPNNYLRMSDNAWYVPNCTRQRAEEILLQRDQRNEFLQPDGAFLVRTSETTAPDFSLSVKYSGQVQHFKVLKDEAGRYHLWFAKFDSINKIIQHHRQHSVSQTNPNMVLRDMLPTPLLHAQPTAALATGIGNASNNNNSSNNSNNNAVVGSVGSAASSAGRQSLQRVIALYDFTPQDPDELSFKQRDVITVLGKEDDSWWLGETEDGRRGVFPYNYVQVHN